MITRTFTFDHRMSPTLTVTRTATVTAGQGCVILTRYGKSTLIRSRFPRLTALRVARNLRRQGYTRTAGGR